MEAMYLILVWHAGPPLSSSRPTFGDGPDPYSMNSYNSIRRRNHGRRATLRLVVLAIHVVYPPVDSSPSRQECLAPRQLESLSRLGRRSVWP
jgi:hypothetical protein